MTYQVLARKWRPQDFSSLIGQEPIVTALRNGLSEGRIAQAYLFSGIRGVGKTTAARVLAKALNCENGPEPGQPAPNPCNSCRSCDGITAGSDIDFIEVDAATYSKVDQIRELTESLRYGPANGRYKIVVLDEVHRLSRQAFDALLKIVEEPPAHLVFIFATTEIDAVPATILSRCQEFQFRRVPSSVLADYLRKISDAENIEARDAALRLIARAGEGSVRDSVALLDQLATFGSGKISDQDAKDLLGGLDTAVFRRLLEAIVEGRGAEISEIVGEIEALGWDPFSVYGQFLVFARDGLQLAMGSQPEAIDLPLEEAKDLADLARSTGYEGLLRLVQLLLESEESVRRSEFGMLAVQIAWLRAAELPKVTRIEQLLAGGPGPMPSGTPPSSGPPSSGPAGSGRASSGRGRGSGTGSPRSAAAPATNSGATNSRATTSRTTAAKAAASQETEAPSKPSSSSAPPMGSSAEPRQVTTREEKAPTPGREARHETQTEAASTDRGNHLPDESPVASWTDGPSRVPLFLERLSTKSPSLAALLNGKRQEIRFDRGKLLVPGSDSQLEGALNRQHNRDLFDHLIQETWGEDAGWTWTAAAPQESAATPVAKAETDDAVAAAEQDPIVQAVLEIFSGSKIQSVRDRPQGDSRP